MIYLGDVCGDGHPQMLYVDEDCIRRGGFDKKFHKGEKSIFKKATKVVVLRLTADTSALSSTATMVMWDSSLDVPRT
jgi:hypothetical protein